MDFLRAVLTGKVVYVSCQMSDDDKFQKSGFVNWLMGELVEPSKEWIWILNGDDSTACVLFTPAWISLQPACRPEVG